MTDLFRSARLQYIKIAKSEKLDAFMLQLKQEPETFNGDPRLPKPASAADIDGEHERYKGSMMLLSVYICLPTAPGTEAAEEPCPIGMMSLQRVGGEPREHHGAAEVGLTLLRHFTGKGYGSEAIGWALWWAFQVAGLHRVGIAAFGWNLGAQRLYERLGFTPEGRARECFYFMGGRHDLVSYGMLASEWRARRLEEHGEPAGLDSEKVAELMGCT